MSAVQNDILQSLGLIMDEETGLITPKLVSDVSTEGERVLRSRRSDGNIITIPANRKRARTFSDSTIENHGMQTAEKKQKLEYKKAVSMLRIMSSSATKCRISSLI